MSPLLRLARCLGHDEFLSGQAIADQLNCSRAAVWKQIEALRARGVEVEALRGEGYRLRHPLELLDEPAIRNAISAPHQAQLQSLTCCDEIESTHAYLLGLPANERHGVVVLAEGQKAGRGRRGRVWESPFARNVYLSLGWRFETGLASLSFLPLVVALAATRALTRIGLRGHGIKWPNDLILDSRKLGGCLVEAEGDVNGPCVVAIGIGLNVGMVQSESPQRIDQPWCDIAEQVPDVSRNQVAGLLIDELVAAMMQYAEDGFERFASQWQAVDVLRDREVSVQQESGGVTGVARGLGRNGGLLLETPDEIREYLAGDVSVRAVVEFSVRVPSGTNAVK